MLRLQYLCMHYSYVSLLLYVNAQIARQYVHVCFDIRGIAWAE